MLRYGAQLQIQPRERERIKKGKEKRQLMEVEDAALPPPPLTIQ